MQGIAKARSFMHLASCRFSRERFPLETLLNESYDMVATNFDNINLSRKPIRVEAAFFRLLFAESLLLLQLL